MRTTSVLAAATLVVVVCSGALVAAGGPTGVHDGSEANYTVSLPSDGGHSPGVRNVTVAHSLVLGDAFEGSASPAGFEDLDHVAFYGPAFDFSDCTREDAVTLGIDRGNNDTGRTVDTDLRRFVKEVNVGEDVIALDFTDDRDLGGYAPAFNATDQLVAVYGSCHATPTDPGWYRFRVGFSGTGYNGTEFSNIELGPVRSHYVYVCECRNRSEAESVLGPPPSEGGGPTPTPTSTPTPAERDDTPMPTRSSTPTSTGVPRLTGTETVTVGELPNTTASPRSSPSPTATPTATPSPTPVDDWRAAVAGVPPTTAAGGVLVAVGLALFAVGRLVWE